MRLLSIMLAGVSALGLGATALAADAAPAAPAAPAATAAPAANSMACGATVAWDATEESLKKQFGADNVVYKDLGGPEGTEMMGTAVNEKIPGKAFSIVWNDEAKRADPAMIFIDETWNEDYTKATPSDWVSGEGIKSGMPLADVEKLNGKPFKISGFGWDYGGNVIGWEDGKLDHPADEKCGLMVTFNPTAENAPEAAMGDQELMSNNKDVIASKPVVGRYIVVYQRPDPAEPIEPK